MEQSICVLWLATSLYRIAYMRRANHMPQLLTGLLDGWLVARLLGDNFDSLDAGYED